MKFAGVRAQVPGANVPHLGKQHGAGLVAEPDILPERRGIGGGVALFPGQARPPGRRCRSRRTVPGPGRGMVVGGELVPAAGAVRRRA